MTNNEEKIENLIKYFINDITNTLMIEDFSTIKSNKVEVHKKYESISKPFYYKNIEYKFKINYMIGSSNVRYNLVINSFSVYITDEKLIELFTFSKELNELCKEFNTYRNESFIKTYSFILNLILNKYIFNNLENDLKVTIDDVFTKLKYYKENETKRMDIINEFIKKNN